MEWRGARFLIVLALGAAACASQAGSNATADAGRAPDGGVEPPFRSWTLCEELARARCALVHRCFAWFDGLSLPDCEEREARACERALDAVSSAVRKGRARLDSARLELCLDTLSDAPCPTAFPPTAPTGARAFEECEPEALFAGYVAEGEICELAQECEPGTRCLGFAGACAGVCTPYSALGELCAGECDPEHAFCSPDSGTCEPLRAEGQSCKSPARCGPMLRCVEDECRPLPGPGEACSPGWVLAPCREGAACDGAPFSGVDGICRERRGVGTPCLYHWSCLPGLVCAGLDWSTWPDEQPGAGSCRAPTPEGHACSPAPLPEYLGDECAAGLICDPQTRVCSRRPRLGAPCLLGTTQCVGPDVVCRPDDEAGGRCGFLPGLGEACVVDLGLDRPPAVLACREGYCDEQGTCRAAWAREGEPCTQDGQCLTGRCLAHSNGSTACGPRCP